MWDFDEQGIVVNVIFPSNPQLNKTSKLSTDAREYYELQTHTDSFYHIQRHKIEADVTYRCIDYLIPTSLAYLVRVGTLADFEKDMEYYYADLEGEHIRNVNENTVLQKYIQKNFGEYVDINIDSQSSLEALIPKTKLKVGYFLEQVHRNHITVQELKAGRKP